MIDNSLLRSRIRNLNEAKQVGGKSVLYVMSRDQRVRDNFALLAAYKHAEANSLSLIVMFNVYPSSGERNAWHYNFMLNGLEQVERELEQLNIPFILRSSSDLVSEVKAVARQIDAEAIYFDFNPLRRPKAHRQAAARAIELPVFEVDTHNIVPLWVTSTKQEYAARTIRPKIHKHLEDYLVEPEQIGDNPKQIQKRPQSLSFDSTRSSIKATTFESYHPQVDSGEQAARKQLQSFLDENLTNYATARNEPHIDGLSGLSVYFHFGQLAPLRAVLEVNTYSQEHPSEEIYKSREVFIEEAVVRRELADNFCYYNDHYDSLQGAADWAQATLERHKGDPREHVYTFEQFENAQTHDSAWNAAQTQLRKTGKIHGYMRMYWAKKFLEWTNSPETALKWAITLNDRYHIDGNDPNGYVGCMWSIAGVHDRGWTERGIFGKIRYMNYAGLKRKKEIEKYEQQWLEGQNTLL